MDKENATLAVGVKYLMADAKSQANWGHVCWVGNCYDSNVSSLYLCSRRLHRALNWWNERVGV